MKSAFAAGSAIALHRRFVPQDAIGCFQSGDVGQLDDGYLEAGVFGVPHPVTDEVVYTRVVVRGPARATAAKRRELRDEVIGRAPNDAIESAAQKWA